MQWQHIVIMYQNYSVWYSFKQFCKLLFSCRAICSGNAIKFGRKTHCFGKTGYVFRFGKIAVLPSSIILPIIGMHSNAAAGVPSVRIPQAHSAALRIAMTIQKQSAFEIYG